MSKSFKYTVVILLSFLLLGESYIFSDKSRYKWYKYGGIWKYENSYINETRGWASPWNYHELTNYNSIISIQPLRDHTEIDFSMILDNPVRYPVEIMASFAIKSMRKQKYWTYHIYAFKFHGNRNRIKKISLIHSDMKDKTIKKLTKKNIFVKELASVNYEISYGKEYRYTIKFNGSKVYLIINGSKLLEENIDNVNFNGKIAFSNRNAKMKIGDVRVKSNEEIIFMDDFTSNTLYIPKLRAVRDKRK